MKTRADKRISLRTNEQTKRYLEAAAILSGFNSLSNFILSISYNEAQKVINGAQVRVLSDRDRAIILDAIENPAAPNEHLRKIIAGSQDINYQD